MTANMKQPELSALSESSSDHRGTPEAPGRVVTLVPSQEWLALAPQDTFNSARQVWGCVYSIDPAHTQEIREYMDYREKVARSFERES